MEQRHEGTERELLLEDGDRVILRFAAVDDQGQAGAAGGVDMDEKIRLLRLAWAEVIVVVQSDFADADAFRVPGKLHQFLGADSQFLVGIMRMSSYREENIGVFFRDAPQIVVAPDTRGDRYHEPDASRLGARQDARQVLLHAVEIKVAVAVDDEHQVFAASSSTKRGKIGAGAGRGVPGTSRLPRSAKLRASLSTLRRFKSDAADAGM